MTNKEIFLRALSKAEENEWKIPFDMNEIYSFDEKLNAFEVFHDEQFIRYTIYEIIFNHKFAEAFWTDDLKEVLKRVPTKTIAKIIRADWRGHLSHMITENEPLKYIKQYL